MVVGARIHLPAVDVGQANPDPILVTFQCVEVDVDGVGEVREVQVGRGTGASDLHASTIDGFGYRLKCLVKLQCQIAFPDRSVLGVGEELEQQDLDVVVELA